MTHAAGNAASTKALFCANSNDAPSLPGAYVLVIELARPLTVALPGKSAASLSPGRYIYCGSARGPGGLKARLSRHMRRGKSVRWHVDRLTEAGAIVGTCAILGGDECELAAALSSLSAPIAGFGSSDCPRCRSHMFRWPEAAAPAEIETLIIRGHGDLQIPRDDRRGTRTSGAGLICRGGP